MFSFSFRKYFKSNISNFKFGSALALLVCLAFHSVSSSAIADEFLAETTTNAEVASVDPTMTYRQTSEGWRDSTEWLISGEEARHHGIEYFHPVFLTLLVVIAVLIAMVLSTSDEELAQMLGDKTSLDCD